MAAFNTTSLTAAPRWRTRLRLSACLGVALAFLSGCASLNKSECVHADWRSIGYEDGVKGYTADRIGEHREACARYGVQPGVDEYTAGRERGLGEYCRAANGYRLGLRGAAYRGVCPAVAEGPFLQAYRQGKAVYAVEQQLESKDAERRRLEDRVQDLERLVRDKEREMVAHDTPVPRRAQLLNEIKHMSAERGRMQEQMHALEHAMDALRAERDDLRAQYAY